MERRGTEVGQGKEEGRAEYLERLAQDIAEEKILTDRHLQSPDQVGDVFPALMMMKEVPPDLDMIFQYLDKASPMAINGMPQFFSFGFLGKEEAAFVIDRANYWTRLKKEARESANQQKDSVSR